MIESFSPNPLTTSNEPGAVVMRTDVDTLTRTFEVVAAIGLVAGVLMLNKNLVAVVVSAGGAVGIARYIYIVN